MNGGGIRFNLFPRYWMGMAAGTVVTSAIMSYLGYFAPWQYFGGIAVGWLVRSMECEKD